MRRKLAPKPKPVLRGGPGLMGFAMAASAYRKRRRDYELAAKLKKKVRLHVV